MKYTMWTLAAAPPRHLQLYSEYDVIAMRQAVRQLARELGLELSQQAKIATAINTIARAHRGQLEHDAADADRQSRGAPDARNRMSPLRQANA